MLAAEPIDIGILQDNVTIFAGNYTGNKKCKFFGRNRQKITFPVDVAHVYFRFFSFLTRADTKITKIFRGNFFLQYSSKLVEP